MTQCSGWQSPGWSNTNLLVNWDFRNPVNQRGQKSYGSGYGIDMWPTSFNANTTVTLTDEGITIANEGQSTSYLRQYLEVPLEENSYICSTKVKSISGAVYVTYHYTDNTSSLTKKLIEGMNTYPIIADKKIDRVQYQVVAGASIGIEAVKLEVGSISTLALDLMQPSDYAAELRKCQRYFYNIGDGSAWSVLARGFMQNTNDAYVSVLTSEPMRVAPSIQWGGELNISTGVKGNKVNDIRLNQFTDEYVGLIATTGGLTSEQYVELTKNNDGNAFLWLSAEL